MTTAAHDDSSSDPRRRYRRYGPWGCWSGGSWGWGAPRAEWGGGNGDAPGGQSWGPAWGQAYPYWAPPFVPRPVLIVLTILAFMWWWPIGLVLLVATLCRRPMFCGHRRWAGWHGTAAGPGAAWKSWFGGERPSSGNRAFDDYRADTLRRLEEEQKEFAEFLDRLRFAKDKAEFDQFMNERRNPPASTPPDATAAPAG